MEAALEIEDENKDGDGRLKVPETKCGKKVKN
jgi:hypothetical protein